MNRFDKSLSSFSVEELQLQHWVAEQIQLKNCVWQNCTFVQGEVVAVDFSQSTFWHVHFNKVRFMGFHAELEHSYGMKGVILRQVHFQCCYFEDFPFTHCIFEDVTFEDCTFKRCRLTALGGSITFERCQADVCTIRTVHATDMVFNHCQFDSLYLKRLIGAHVKLRHCEIEYFEPDGAKLKLLQVVQSNIKKMLPGLSIHALHISQLEGDVLLLDQLVSAHVCLSNIALTQQLMKFNCQIGLIEQHDVSIGDL